MMRFLTVFILSLSFFYQAPSQQLVKFIFINNCAFEKKANVQFTVISTDPSNDYHYSISKKKKEKIKLKKDYRYLMPGKYIVKCVIKRNNYNETFEEPIIINNLTTKVKINIPKLKIQTSIKEEDLNSFDNYKNYYYCNKLCNGKYTDYFYSNKKRIEGEFTNGKPTKLITYGKYDNSKTITVFNNEWQPLKVEKYNKSGNLFETTVYTYKKRYIIVKKYNSGNKLIEKNKYNRY